MTKYAAGPNLDQAHCGGKGGNILRAAWRSIICSVGSQHVHMLPPTEQHPHNPLGVSETQKRHVSFSQIVALI